MFRRSSLSRRPSLESLEARCNPAALVPIAESLIEAAPVVENGNLQIASLTSVAIDPSASLAGQTVRLRIAAVNNQGKLLVGVDDVRLTIGVGQDQTTHTGGISKFGSARLLLQGDGAYVPSSFDPLAGVFADPTAEIQIDPVPSNTKSYFTNDYSLTVSVAPTDSALTNAQIVDLVVDPSNRDTVYLGGHGDDVLIGGVDQDPRSAPNGRLYVATNVGVFVEAAAGNDPATDVTGNAKGAQASGTITALVDDPSNPNIAYSRPDLERIIDDIALDVAISYSRSSSSGGDYYTGTVTVSGD